MILKERGGELKSNCKPRASGDDPAVGSMGQVAMM